MVCGYGIICMLLAKLTVIYSVPPINQNILSYLIAKLKDGFNDGNILTLFTKQKPLYAFIIFVVMLAGIMLSKPKKSNAVTAQ
jgi:hypothetical protein